MPNGTVLTSGDWRAAVEGVTAFAFASLDNDGRIRLWNAGAEAVFGYKAHEITGKFFGDLFPEGERNAGQPATLLRDCMEKDRCSIARYMQRKDGSQVFMEGDLSALAGQAGFTLILRPGAERLKLQHIAERLTGELHQFAFTVSHDLKAPLRSVKSFAELLERRYRWKLDEDATEYIAYIVDGAKQIEQLLNDVLAYSQAGRDDKTRPQAVDTTGVLQWAVMNVDAARKETGAEITWDPLPAVWVDQAQLAQVFQHLLTNAIKFRGEQQPRIHVSSQPAADDMVRLSVKDNGIGIDAQYHERIFGIFKRLHGRDVPGTGIGLAICRKIVEAHGGRMWLESEEGKGTTFHFTVPPA